MMESLMIHMDKIIEIKMELMEISCLDKDNNILLVYKLKTKISKGKVLQGTVLSITYSFHF